MDVETATVPGIGTRIEFSSAAGQPTIIMSHDSGERDLMVFASPADDVPAWSVRFTAEEAHAFAVLLQTVHIADEIAACAGPGSASSTWLSVPPHSTWIGRPPVDVGDVLGSTSSVVAVVRDGVLLSPQEAAVLAAEDALLVLRTT